MAGVWQLYCQMKEGAVFENFTEAPITFAPTYKYDPGTTIYDSSEKRRTPAWCDRVLFYGQNIVPLLVGAVLHATLQVSSQERERETERLTLNSRVLRSI